MMQRTQVSTVGALLACAFLLTGCAAESTTGSAGGTGPDNSSPASNPPAEPNEPDAAPVTQEATCDWDSDKLTADAPPAPTSTDGDLATAIIGAWQHTHIDEGSGYKPLKPTTDIRFVFPSTTTMLYCQNVASFSTPSERQVTMSLDGLEIILPEPATGYAVTAWDANTMVWENHRDGTFYLLQRR